MLRVPDVRSVGVRPKDTIVIALKTEICTGPFSVIRVRTQAKLNTVN